MIKHAGIIASVGATAIAGAVVVADAQAQGTSSKEKCYGVVKAGMNDCGTSEHGCAGLASVDGHPKEWLFLPAGTCEKLTGGSLEPS